MAWQSIDLPATAYETFTRTPSGGPPNDATWSAKGWRFASGAGPVVSAALVRGSAEVRVREMWWGINVDRSRNSVGILWLETATGDGQFTQTLEDFATPIRFTSSAGDTCTEDVSNGYYTVRGRDHYQPYCTLTFVNGLSSTAQGISGTLVLTDDGVDPDDVVDETAPTLVAAAANGATLVLTYDEPLDTSSVPATSAFDVTVAGSSRGVSAVAVAGSAVSLTLSSAVTQGQTVTVDYAAPSSNPIQDAAGNEAADFSNESVTNNTGVVLSDAVAPSLTIAAVGNINEGESHTFRVTPTGGTYDTIAYQWAVASGGGSIGATTGVYRAPTVNADVTNAQVRVTATVRGTGTEAANNTSATSTDTETFTIKNVPKGTRPAVTPTRLTWHDAAPPLTDATPKLWVAQRRVPGSPAAGAAKQAAWGDWTNPTPTSLLGGGLEFIFAVTSGTTAPALPSNSWGFDQPVSPWFDAAPAVRSSRPYLWMSQRPLVGAPRVGDSVAGTWTDPRIVSRYGRDGRDGRDGTAASLTDGSVETHHLALSATASVHVIEDSGANNLTGNRTASDSIPGGSGYNYLATGFASLDDDGNRGTYSLHLNGVRQDGLETSGGGGEVFFSLAGGISGPWTSDADMSIEIRPPGSANYDLHNMVMTIFVAKR